MGVSGGPGEGDPYTGNLENSLKDDSACGVSFSVGALLGEPGGGLLC